MPPPHPRVSYSTFFSCPICGRTWANSAATSSPRRFQDSLQSGGGASSEAGGHWGERKAIGSTRCQQDQAQEGFLSQPLQPPTLKNLSGHRSFLPPCLPHPIPIPEQHVPQKPQYDTMDTKQAPCCNVCFPRDSECHIF